MAAHQGQQRSWAETFRAFADRKVIALLFLGFSAGVPILLIFSTMSVWLREAEVSRATIGFFSWAALGYAFKFVWAPLIDKMPVPALTAIMGRRRAWLLVSQIAIMASLVLMALNDPQNSLALTAGFAVLLGFSSATQDVVIDAYRIEAATKEMQGLMSSAYIAGYRVGMLVAGAGALEIAGLFESGGGYDFDAWSKTYLVMSGVMLIGVLTTFVVSEPKVPVNEDDNLKSRSDYARFLGSFLLAASAFVALFLMSSDLAAEMKAVVIGYFGLAKGLAGFLVECIRLILAVLAAVGAAFVLIKTRIVPEQLVTETYLAPFRDFFQRYGRTAVLILALIATYRIADVVMGVMANVFYVDLGFEKQEIGRITKGFGLIMTIIGGFVGGAFTMHYGIMRTLFLGAVLAAGTNLLFAVLAGMGNDLYMLMAVISADNLSAGIASAAFVAYLSGLTNAAFTASQYALFSSIMLLLPKILAGYSGIVVEAVGYAPFFIGTAVLGLPVLALVFLVSRLPSQE
jgi:MFS transporter, PAT family, beta-lactamase induction signal transducer AmpG